MQIQKCKNHSQASDAWLYTYELIALVKTTRYLSPENNVNNKVYTRKWKLISQKLHYIKNIFFRYNNEYIWFKMFYYTRKKHLHLCKCFFISISSFLSSRAASSQVLSAFVSLTSVFGMGTGGASQLSPLNLWESVLSKPYRRSPQGSLLPSVSRFFGVL